MTTGPETRYRVRGGNTLQGTVFVQGAKNAALKMIAASLLAARGRTVLRNVPPIEDVRRAVELAQALGAVVKFHEAEQTLVVDASNLTSPVLPAEIARRFRSSVLFVPALLHRFGEAVIEGVGGCNLGNRNLDFHYRGFARLGAVVDEGDTTIRVKASKLQGAHLYLDTPSHTGTENLIMAACLAPGRTVIDNTAQEPEVLDVIAFLTKMGARITGGGTGFITVHGVDELTAVEHTVMADRIDAGVFAMAAAITGGELSLVGASLENLGVVRWKLEQMGVEFAAHGAILGVRRDRQLRMGVEHYRQQRRPGPRATDDHGERIAHRLRRGGPRFAPTELQGDARRFEDELFGHRLVVRRARSQAQLPRRRRCKGWPSLAFCPACATHRAA